MIKATTTISTPNSATDPTDVIFEEIPLPPIGEPVPAPVDNAGASATPQVAEPARLEERLDFVTPPHVTVPLQYPFRRSGRLVDAITVRRLTIGEVSNFVRAAGPQPLSTFDIYAAMTGMPAEVLRGLVDVDGNSVTDVAYDFLPPQLRMDVAPSQT